jgi:hypothetical protein
MLERQRTDLQNKRVTCEQAVVRHRRRAKELQLEVQRAEDTVEKLQEEADRDNVEDGLLDLLYRSLKDVEDERGISADSYTRAIEARENFNDISSTLKKELDRMNDGMKDAEAKMAKAAGDIANQRRARERALHEKNLAHERIQDSINDVKKVDEDRKRQIDIVAKFVSEAEQICPRVPVDRGETRKSLESKLGKAYADLEVAKKQ